MVVAPYIVRDSQPADEDNILELLRISLGEGPGKGLHQSLWQWKHVTNPFGPSYVKLACDEGGQVIGLRAFMRWEFKSGNHLIKAVRAVDTSTHPDYRRLGVFSTLTKGAVDDLARDGVDLIFNTPNQYSLPGYLKMGWHYVATLRPMICVLNPSRFFFGLMRSRLGHPNFEPYPREEFFRRPLPELRTLLDRQDLEPLISRFAHLSGGNGNIITSRSVEYLRWRYAEHPDLTYYSLSIGADSRPEGCATFRTNTRFGLKEVMLCELFLTQLDDKLCRRLLDQLRASLQADYLIAYFRDGTPLQRALKRCGFRSVPRLGMDFTVKPLSPTLPVDPLRLQNWAPSLGDLELF